MRSAPDFTIACPAFPENGRTICRGYLFVGDVLLSESGMKDHPLTPMTDANLVRVLQAQTRRKVGLIRYDMLARGAEALREEIAKLQQQGTGIAIVDALAESDLHCIAEGCADLPLVTAGSGVGLGIAEHHRRAGRLSHAATAAALPRRSRSRRRSLGELLGGHQRPGRALDAIAARVPHRSSASSQRERRSSRTLLPGRKRECRRNQS